MSLKEKLQIIVITYNREKHVRNMLGMLLAANAPTRELNILVLDNNSTDGTADVVKSFQAAHANVSYQKNHYNLGIGGNIARAMEIANQEYVWILGDDDVLHFEAWPDLEEAIAQNKEIIVAANYAIKKGKEKDPAYLMGQLTFISACVFKTSLFSDTTMTNVINNIYTLFPHLVPVVEYINDGKTDQIYALPHALASNGMKPETDCSYVRGYQNEKVYLKQRSMSWIVGYANVLVELKDKKLLHRMMARPMHGIYRNWSEFYRDMYVTYGIGKNWLPILETARALSVWRRCLLWMYLLSPIKVYRHQKGIYACLFWTLKTRLWSNSRIRDSK